MLKYIYIQILLKYLILIQNYLACVRQSEFKIIFFPTSWRLPLKQFKAHLDLAVYDLSGIIVMFLKRKKNTFLVNLIDTNYYLNSLRY